jgi:transcriptional regulator with XRE-family HTH domain
MTAEDNQKHVECFGKAVAQLRELRKITREQLAKKSGVKLPVLISIEDGTADGMSFGLDEICRLSKGMGITAQRLMMAYENFLDEAGL